MGDQQRIDRIGKAVEGALRSYRCQYTMLLGTDDGLPLVDTLCPPGAGEITLGDAELVLLADDITIAVMVAEGITQTFIEDG